MKVQQIDLGNQVFCDYCGDDYTSRDETGGILFGSHACCPPCAKEVERDAIKFGEQQFIRDRCPDGVKFCDWVLWLRGGDNTVTIISCGSPEP